MAIHIPVPPIPGVNVPIPVPSVTIFGGGGCASGISCIASEFLYIINYVLVPTLFAVAFLTFLWGVAQAYIFSAGDPTKVETGHKLVLWGLIGFVVMVSLWGLVNMISNTFGLGGYYAPSLPTSY